MDCKCKSNEHNWKIKPRRPLFNPEMNNKKALDNTRLESKNCEHKTNKDLHEQDLQTKECETDEHQTWRQVAPTSKNIHPVYLSYQLLGDSQFVRFSENVLDYDYTTSRKIQYCISGQTIHELYINLGRKEFQIHDRVLVMIGTNDFLRGRSLDYMILMYSRVVNVLRCKCEKIVLVTIPPIPLLGDDEDYWIGFKNFNNFILMQENGRDVFVVDITNKLLSGNKIKREYFEETYLGSMKPDLVHLNTKGFQLIKDILYEKYFKFVDLNYILN